MDYFVDRIKLKHQKVRVMMMFSLFSLFSLLCYLVKSSDRRMRSCLIVKSLLHPISITHSLSLSFSGHPRRSACAGEDAARGREGQAHAFLADVSQSGGELNYSLSLARSHCLRDKSVSFNLAQPR